MILFYIVGTLFATLGLFMYLDVYFFRKQSRTVNGKVIGYETSKSKNGHYYHPVVEYSDQGNTYRFKADIGSNRMSYTINESVEVLILENKHSSARLKRMARPMLALAFLLMGLMPIVIAVYDVENSENQVYALEAALLLLIAGTFMLLHFSKIYRDKKEKEFKYDQNADGVVGYVTTQGMITDAEVVQKATVSKTAHAIGVFIGVGVIAGSLYWADHLHTYIDKAVRTHGIIVSQKSSTSDGSTTYAPIIEFAPYKSDTIRFTSSISSSSPSWKVGDGVFVFYDPDNSSDTMMDSGWFNYFFQIMLGFVGLIVFLVSSWQFWKKSQAEEALDVHEL